MRKLLTFIAVALVIALTVALVAPPLIDWSARREMVARAVSARIGERVVVSGPIALRMLPTPYLELAEVAIGPPGAPFLEAPSIRFELGLFSLFGGRLQLQDMRLEHPTLRLGPDFAPAADGPLQFDHIAAHHAEIVVAREGAARIALHDVEFEGSAASPRGPFRGAGDFALPGSARARYQFAADAFQFDALPLRAEFDAGAARASLDGRIVLGPAPAYDGTARLMGEAAGPEGAVWPIRLAGLLRIRGDEARLDAAKASLGPDARALEAEGAFALKFADGLALDADLKAKTLNLDSLLRRDKETFAPPARALAAFGALAGETPLAAFSLKLEAASAFLGARPLETPRFALSGAAHGALRLGLQTGLPGRGRLGLDGDLDLGLAPIFRGRATFAVGEVAPLAAWISEGDPARAAQLAALQAVLPPGAVGFESAVEASSEGFAARALKLDLAASHLTGDAIYRRPDPDRRGSLYLDLATDALDIDAAPNLAAGLDGLGDADLDFRLAARKLRVARLGLASVESGSLSVKAKREGAKLSLEQLSLADLGGASIEAQGETSPAGRWARVKLDAGRLHDFASLLARAAPGPWTRALQARADDLGSAKATFEARRDGPPLDGAFSLDFLKADGEIAATRFGLTLTHAPAPVDAVGVAASLDAPDAGALLRKLGLQIPAGPAGRAQLSLDATGGTDAGFEGKARLALAGVECNGKGALDVKAARLAGPLACKGADMFPALAALGLAASGAGVPAPIDLTADFAATPEGGKLDKLAGLVAGARVKGDLGFVSPVARALSLEQLVALAKSDAHAAPAAPAIQGALDIDHATASALLTMTLGRAGPTRPGALWSESKFAAPLLIPPTTDIALKIAALDIGALAAKGVSARLRLDHDAFALDDVALAVGGGRVSGRLSLRRDRTQATASGALRLEGVLIDRPAARARADAEFDFAAAGASPLQLIASLAGAGHLSLADAKLPRHDPDALARVMAKLEQAAGAPPDAGPLTTLIGAELDRGALTLAHVESPLSLTSGALRFGPFDAPARDGSASLSGALALTDLTLSTETTLIDDKTGRFWTGAPPTIEALARGPLDGLARKLDVSLLLAGLATEAIARESERIANFEADVRERAAFNRRLKAERFLARRTAEIAAFEAAEERRRLMETYLAPYAAWGTSRREGAGP